MVVSRRVAGIRLAPHSAQKIVPSNCLDWQLLQTCIAVRRPLSIAGYPLLHTTDSGLLDVLNRRLPCTADNQVTGMEGSGSCLALFHCSTPYQAARTKLDPFAPFVAG